MIATTFKQFFKNLYIRFKGRPGALKKAMRRADSLYRKKRKRYRVYFLSGQYQALSRREIQRKKHSGQWNRNVNVTKLEPLAFYDTLTGITAEGRTALTRRNPYRH